MLHVSTGWSAPQGRRIVCLLLYSSVQNSVRHVVGTQHILIDCMNYLMRCSQAPVGYIHSPSPLKRKARRLRELRAESGIRTQAEASESMLNRVDRYKAGTRVQVQVQHDGSCCNK